ncbi:hypothetical protein GGS21DRAFT_266346 [Xylaria nigripes]|nr:hypothetical protein GGS21DRAFT_266346 [Xylaria nigripes]
MLPSQSKRRQAAAPGFDHSPSRSDPPVTPGMPFRKMFLMKADLRRVKSELAWAENQLNEAQKSTSYPPTELEQLQSAVRFKSAELISLQKKLEPLEANYQKSIDPPARNTNPIAIKKRAADSSETRQSKKQKIEDGEPKYARSERDPVENLRPGRDSLNMTHQERGPNRARSELDAVIKEPLINTATLDILISTEGCNLSADECQYAHLDRLRRQYAHPFELFCEEMDTISDSCLTGLCLAIPDMPWSVIVSRLAFLFKSTIDGGDGRRLPPPDLQYLSTGTTIGCGQHLRYIRLCELMVIQDWRDFMRWAHHQSHIYNLCGQPNCIKLKHMCLEPIDCMTSRNKCRTNFQSLYGGKRLTNQPIHAIPPTCSSPGCWPPCLFRNQFTNILHSATVEFAAFHQVSFGPVTSAVRGDLYTPINEHQLGKLIQDEKSQLVFPFEKSYGHILVNKWESNALVEVDTLVPIPSLYTSGELVPILDNLSTRTKLSFNDTLSSLFWYARRRYTPFLAQDSRNNPVQSARFDCRSPRYQCPFCHGFDNYDNSTNFGMVGDFGDFIKALEHMLHAHSLVPLTRKLKFLYEETFECPTISNAWKAILQENYDAVIASLGNGELPLVLADLCGYGTSADRPFVHDDQETPVNEELVAMPDVKMEEVIN